MQSAMPMKICDHVNLRLSEASLPRLAIRNVEEGLDLLFYCF